MVRISFIVALTILSTQAVAQVNRYVVYLTDKSGTPYSVTAPETFLSERAIQRRVNQNIEIVTSDLPVDPDYTAGVAATGAEVFFSSKWFNALIIQAESSIVGAIGDLSYVSGIEQIAPGEKRAKGSRKTRKTTAARRMNIVNTRQLNQIGLNNLHDEGYRGQGIRMAFFDSGFRGVDTATPFSHIFDSDRMIYTFNAVENHNEVFQSDDHGTETFSTVSAFSDNEYTGAAYEAEFMLFLTEDTGSEYRIEEFNWLVAIEKADSAGADVVSSSLGYNTFNDAAMNYTPEDMDGNTAVVTRAADLAAQKGILVVTSSGNEANDPNWRIITAPADADSVISVGMVDAAGNLGSGSSGGPTADGRIKPEVMALGVSTSIIRDNGSTGTNSGTSFSAPLIAGFAACIWQSKPTLTNMQLRDTILSISTRAATPDNQFGYGIPQYGAIITSIDDLAPEDNLILYPNPLSDNILRIEGDKVDFTQCFVAILDSRGAVVDAMNYSQIKDRNSLEINTQRMKSGTYFVELRFASFSRHFKIIKY